MGNQGNFTELMQNIANEKGLPVDLVARLFTDSLMKAYRKQLGKEDDALIRVTIDLAKDSLEVFRQYHVVETVNDDFLEVDIDDIKDKAPELKPGDLYEVPIPLDEFLKSTARNVMSIFHQNITEAEKSAIEQIYKQKIGEIIIGNVEKVDNVRNSIIVNIGRTSVVLPAREQIPGETFKNKERVKLYLDGVKNTPKGAQIAVTRRNGGFLKRLFEEEIHEIYDGTVIIKDIAREAGERSKVAVYSKDPNVDPAGACIGQNGVRIQKIVAQLGNAKEKEKIDIITYSSNPSLYIIESIKPSGVVGLNIDIENKKALLVVPNEQSKVAIGRKGFNIRLASKLTGYEIEVKEEDEANKENLVYKKVDEIRREEENKAYLERSRQDLDKYKQTQTGDSASDNGLSNNYGAELTDEDLYGIKKEPEPVVTPVIETKAEEPVAVMPVQPEKVLEKVIEEPVKEPVKEVVTPVVEKTIIVKTTKTLEELEEQLKREKLKEASKVVREPRDRTKPFKKEYKKPEPEEKKPVANLTPTSYMNVYSEEELQALEAEEEEHVDEEIDFDEYEDYYEDQE